jgi:ADP-heptose:LPS heptosyltransferase
MIKALLKRAGLLRAARAVRRALRRCLEALAALFSRHPQDSGPAQRVLAVRLDRVGDIVLTTPALQIIKEACPRGHLAVLVRRAVKDLIDGLPFIDEIIVREDFSFGALVRRLREGRFDAAVGFHPGFFVNVLGWFAGVPRRIGYRYYGSEVFLTQSIPDDREVRVRHEADSACEVTVPLGVTCAQKGLAVAVRQEAERFAEEFFRRHQLAGERTVLIHPGSRQAYIRWGEARFGAVADRLMEEQGVRVILLAGPGEGALVSRVTSHMKREAVVASELTLAQAVSVIKRCRLFIGNSTGPMHIAAALNVPIVAVFGSRHPLDSVTAWGPREVPHTVLQADCGRPACHPGDCRDYVCMDRIGVDDVVRAAQEHLRS